MHSIPTLPQTDSVRRRNKTLSSSTAHFCHSCRTARKWKLYTVSKQWAIDSSEMQDLGVFGCHFVKQPSVAFDACPDNVFMVIARQDEQKYPVT
eukprot:scaffold89211_cov22-Prasinocladus_malaysianus.AAC.1